MKKWFLFLAAFVLQALSLHAADSLALAQAKGLSQAVIQQLHTNTTNTKAGHSTRNNYLIQYQTDAPSVYHTVIRNNGQHFWKDVNTDSISAAIRQKSALLGGTGYYVVVASVFNYADTEFDTDAAIDWTQVKSGTDRRLLSTDAEKSQRFLNRLFQYVKNAVNLQVSSQDFVINYFLTVFSVDSEGRYKISYRTFVQYGSQLQSLGVGLPTQDARLLANARYDKTRWIIDNINADAYWVSQYKSHKGDLTVMDYTAKLSPEQLAALKDLFGGKKPLTDERGLNRHTLKSRLFITQQGLANYASDTAFISQYQPPYGQVALWIDFAGNTPQVKRLKFGDDGTRRSYEDIVRSLQKDPRTFWQELLSSMPKASLADVCSALYEVMDWMGKGIAYLHLPGYVWNCNESGYKPVYAEVFKYNLWPVVQLQNTLLEPLLKTYAPAVYQNTNATQLSFAVACGLWNGLVDAVKAIPDGIKLLASIHNSNASHKDWAILHEAIGQKGGGFGGFCQVVWQGLKELHDPGQPCVLAHAVGSDIFVLLAAYFTAGESLAGATTGNALKTLLVTLDRLEIIGKAISKATGFGMQVVMQGGKTILKFASQAGKPVFNVIREGTKTAFQIIDATRNTFKDLDWSLGKQVQIIGVDGKSYAYTVLTNPLENVSVTIKQIRELVKDGDGQVVKDAEGNGLAVVEDQAGKQQLAIVKAADNVVDRLFRNIEDFKAAIAKGENVFYVGTHSDITPRPSGVQSHHGVNSVWMEGNFSNYVPDDAPSVYMLNHPNHNATRGVFNTWRADIVKLQATSKVDYSKISKEEILKLAEKQFDAAGVPKVVREEYFKLWEEYLKTLTSK
jgi:hypothetical protein